MVLVSGRVFCSAVIMKLFGRDRIPFGPVPHEQFFPTSAFIPALPLHFCPDLLRYRILYIRQVFSQARVFLTASMIFASEGIMKFASR